MIRIVLFLLFMTNVCFADEVDCTKHKYDDEYSKTKAIYGCVFDSDGSPYAKDLVYVVSVQDAERNSLADLNDAGCFGLCVNPHKKFSIMIKGVAAEKYGRAQIDMED